MAENIMLRMCCACTLLTRLILYFESRRLLVWREEGFRIVAGFPFTSRYPLTFGMNTGYKKQVD